MADSKLVTYENYTPNKTDGRTRSGKTYTVDTITIHCTAGSENSTAKGTVDYFMNPSRGASSTYCVGGDGSIAQGVKESDRPWTTGGDKTVNGETGSINDYHAITMEVASNKDASVVTDKALEATIKLCVDIMQRHGKTKAVWFGNDAKKMVDYKPAVNEMKFTWHCWFASKSCPGPYLKNKFQYIIDEINSRLAGGEPVTPVTPQPTTSYSISVKRVLPLNYYAQPDETSKVNGQIKSPGIYTIVAESGLYGKLKSGVGYVKLTDVDDLNGNPIKTTPVTPEPQPVKPDNTEAKAIINEIRALLDKLEKLV